jgi:hypothetical protein
MNLLKKLALALLLTTGLFVRELAAIPLNNVYDTQPLYSYLLSDKFYKKRDSQELSIQLTPFYQHANTARDAAGKKVPGGDRLGSMNMFGVFFDSELASRQFDAFNYSVAQPAQGIVRSVTTNPADGTNPYYLGADSTVKADFKPQDNPFAYLSVPINYEKIGVRGQMNYDLSFGVGLSVRFGVADIKCKPRQFVLEGALAEDSNVLLGETDPRKLAAKKITDALFAPDQRDAVAKDFDINLKTYHRSSVEDVHVQAYWHYPIECKDGSGAIGVVVIPYLAVGTWLPIAKKPTQDDYFGVPFGNQGGDYGLTLEGSIGLDFPVVPQEGRQSMGFTLGGGALLFGSEEMANQRFPSTDKQVAIFPWKVARLNKRTGETWYVNIGFKAEEFLEGFSFYADYSYINHSKDRIAIKESTALSLAGGTSRQALFDAGVASYENNSAWKNQQIASGMSFKMSPSIMLSGAVQAHISGVRVLRAVTVLGGLTVTF